MKRLLRGASSVMGQPGGDVFKAPPSRASRRDGHTSEEVEDGVRAQPSVPAKGRSAPSAERSRPLPRGDSTAGAPDVLQRRVVSLGKRTKPKPAPANTGPASRSSMGTLVLPDDEPMPEVVMRKRKRKSLSPKSETSPRHVPNVMRVRLLIPCGATELDPSEMSSRDLVLAPDTPVKASPLNNATFRNPFSRAPSLPSFAALGAAFRAGPAPPDGIVSAFRPLAAPPVSHPQIGSPGNWRSLLPFDDVPGEDPSSSAISRTDVGEPAVHSTPKRPSRVPGM